MGPVVYFGLCLLGCLIFNPAVEGTRNISLPSPRSRCPSGTLYYNRFCYEFFGDPVSWEDAEAECAYWRKDSHLASVLTAAEERSVNSFIRRYSSNNAVWVGLQAIPTPLANPMRLTWAWSDSSPYRSGSPLWDNRTPSVAISTSQCVALLNVQSPTTSTRWAQYTCTTQFPYVCKFRAST